MNYKEAIDKIKTLLSFGEQQPSEPAEVPAEQPVVEVPVEQPAEAPVELNEQPAEVQQPDFAAQIQVLTERISQLEKQNAQFSAQIEEAKTNVGRVAEAQTQTLALVEQIAEEPTGEPAQKPTNLFKKTDTAAKNGLAAAFDHVLKNNK